jgi:hypothetical protein
MDEEKTFTLQEARFLVPWLREITEQAEQKAYDVRKRQNDPSKAREELQYIIQHWAETITKLGALPKQPFTVDFNSGHDYYCWEYPEKEILYRHSYRAGYAGRRRIEEET